MTCLQRTKFRNFRRRAELHQEEQKEQRTKFRNFRNFRRSADVGDFRNFRRSGSRAPPQKKRSRSTIFGIFVFLFFVLYKEQTCKLVGFCDFVMIFSRMQSKSWHGIAFSAAFKKETVQFFRMSLICAHRRKPRPSVADLDEQFVLLPKEQRTKNKLQIFQGPGNFCSLQTTKSGKSQRSHSTSCTNSSN